MRPSIAARRLRPLVCLTACALLALGAWHFSGGEDAVPMSASDARVSAPERVENRGVAGSGARLPAGSEHFRRRARERNLDAVALRAQFQHDTGFERHFSQLLAYWRLLDAIDDFRDFHDAMPADLRADRALEILVEIPAQLRGQRLLPAEAISLTSALLPMTQLPDDTYRRLVEDIADTLFSEEVMPSPASDPRTDLYQREASLLVSTTAQGMVAVKAQREMQAALLEDQLLALRRSIYGTASR